MTALVTGATGFVGSAVLRRLIGRGWRTRALVRPKGDRRNLDGLEVDLVEGDLLDPSSLDRALDGCEALFHVAANYRLWVPDPATIYAVNVEGTRSLMEAALAAGVGRIVYTSSVATLGLNSDASPADEDTPVSLDDMIGHYKRSKYLAEAEVRQMVKDQGLPAVIVNPSTPVGPRDVRPTPTGRMIIEAASGRIPAFVQTGLNIVHVDDVAAGHLAAYDRGVIGERYVLGGDNLSLEEILRQIAVLTHRRAPRVKLPHNLVLPVAHVAEAWARLSRGGEPFVTVDGVRLAKKWMFFTYAKAERDLGYMPRATANALGDAVEWFGANGYLG